jgi:HD superfamily phosphohydrolase
MGEKSEPKLLYDSVHKLVPFENTDSDRLLLSLIDTKEFQRLRRIKQLGFSETVFPGATHSRFAHSIGVAHIAREFLNRIDLITGKPTSKGTKVVVLAAALLHDLGHGPFSHAFEKVTRVHHEKRTRQIVLDRSTEVHRALSNHDRRLPDLVADFWAQDLKNKQTPKYLAHIVSSQLDADRFDYLMRDSYATGVDYGEFDYRWLLTHLSLDGNKGRLQLSNKALLAAEAYIFARYHMHKTVYFHKTTRGAEVMFRLLLRRFVFLIDDRGIERTKRLVPAAPPAFIVAFTKKENDLKDFLALDDHSVSEFCKSAAKSKDSILKQLASGLLDRRYFKSCDLTGMEAPKIAEFQNEITTLLEKRKFSTQWNWASDSPGDTPYKAYDPDSEKENTQIYVEDAFGVPREISKLSKPVVQLREAYAMHRFYFPENLRDEIMQIKDRTIQGTHNA